MAHRFNNKMNMKTPKPSATERTWSRWRIRHAIDTNTDKVRLSRIEEIKEKAMERLTWMKNIKLVKKNEDRKNSR